MKHLLIGWLFVLAFAACAQEPEGDYPQYHADTQAWQRAQNNCAAMQKGRQAFDKTMADALFTCDGLNFDAQQPGQPGQPLAQRLYARYCVKAAGD